MGAPPQNRYGVSKAFDAERKQAVKENNVKVITAIDRVRKYENTGGGRSLNIFRNNVRALLAGKTQAEFDEQVRHDQAQMKASRRMSAGLRKSGNAAIKAKQDAHLNKTKSHESKAQQIKVKENRFSNNNVIFKNEKAINPKSDEGKTIQAILDRQKRDRAVNAEQKKLFSAITGAKNAAEAIKIRSAAMSQNPNVGTHNTVIDRHTGKIKETQGVLGSGTGEIKDLDYTTYDRSTGRFAENKQLGNMLDSKGNVIAKNVKSSAGSEWSFEPVDKKSNTIALPKTAAGFLGGLNLFGSSPPKESTMQSPTERNEIMLEYDKLFEQYDYDLSQYEIRLAAFENWNPTEAEYEEYNAEYQALLSDSAALESQYNFLENNFESQKEHEKEWGGYLDDSQKAWEFMPDLVQNPQSTQDSVYNAAIKSGSNTLSGVTNIGIWIAEQTDPLFGTTTPKGLYRDFYSTPVTNVEGAVFGTAIGGITQGTGYFSSGAAEKNAKREWEQLNRNFERDPVGAWTSTFIEGAFYAPFGAAKGVYNFFKGSAKGAASSGATGTAEGAAKSASKTFDKPKKPTWNEWQNYMILQNSAQGIPASMGAYGRGVIKAGKEAGYTMIKDSKIPKPDLPKIPNSKFPDIFNPIKKKSDFPTVPKNMRDLPKVKDSPFGIKLKGKDLPIPKKAKGDLPVTKKPKGGIAVPKDFGFPMRVPKIRTPRTIRDVPRARGGRGFVFPFGFPNFSFPAGGGGTGRGGKPQGRKKYTAWDVKTHEIGFYGWGRKSDDYGGVFDELDTIDKSAKKDKNDFFLSF